MGGDIGIIEFLHAKNRLDVCAPGGIGHIAFHPFVDGTRYLIAVVLLPEVVGDDFEEVGDAAESPGVGEIVKRQALPDLSAVEYAGLLRRGFQNAFGAERAYSAGVGDRPRLGNGRGKRTVRTARNRPGFRSGEGIALLDRSIGHPR
jgi:hypothetical protein